MYSQYETTFPPGPEGNLDEEQTGESEESVMITTSLEAQDGNGVDETQA
jgi:hypothetical protein